MPACVAVHITLRSETTSLIDAVSEFGERDGGSGGRQIRGERGKQIKKRERAGEASIKRRNQIVFLAFALFLFSFSSQHLPAPRFLIFSFTHTHTHTQKVCLLCMAMVRCQEDIESWEVEVRRHHSMMDDAYLWLLLTHT